VWKVIKQSFIFNISEFDVCVTGQHGCHENAECHSSYNSYSCKCKVGYYGDGFDCQRMLSTFTLFRVRVMVFKAFFYNILDISWQSVLLVEETGVPGENLWPAASHWQTLSHNVVSHEPHIEQVNFCGFIMVCCY